MVNQNPMFAVNSTTNVPTYVDRVSQPQVYDTETQLIRGTMSFSKDKLRELDPSYTGYTHIFVLRLPPFMTAIANGRVISGYDSDSVAKAQAHCKNLKAMLELGSTSYSGTPDLQLNTTEVNTGFSERSYPVPTYAQYDGKQFTIRCLETRGEPLRRAIEYYINGVSDANVKATALQGALDASGALMAPTLPNIAFVLMAVQTDQTLLHIQDISIWNSGIATNIDRSNLDWENGNIDIIQAKDIQFTGVYMPDTNNTVITTLAKKLLGTRLALYKRYQDMDATDLGTSSWNTIGAAY